MLNTAPHILCEESNVKKEFKKSKAWFAHFITEYDVGEETSWWYCIKDERYDVGNFKAKNRYEINKGRKNFFVQKINPEPYDRELLDLDIQKFSDYPKAYKPTLSEIEKSLKERIFLNKNNKWFGLFDKENKKLCGYGVVGENGVCINLNVVTIDSSTYKRNSSVALIDGILTFYDNYAGGGCYLCDGARNVKHITNYQEFLISNFNFRKVYCKAKFICKWWVKPILFIALPFKKLLLKSNNKLFYNLGCILRLKKYANLSIK